MIRQNYTLELQLSLWLNILIRESSDIIVNYRDSWRKNTYRAVSITVLKINFVEESI